MLKVVPAPFITTKVIAIVQGTITPAASALITLQVNRKTTTTDSNSPSMIASRTLRNDSRTSTVVAPTLLVKDQTHLDLGGRTLQVTAHGNAHTDCDLTVLDPQTDTLLLSDLLFVERVPSLDGSLKGWLAELETLKSVGAKRAVPGHGPTGVDWPSASRDLERYLGVLLRETRQAIATGVDIDQAAKTVARAERDKWKLFDDYNGHNVTRAYKELEWD